MLRVLCSDTELSEYGEVVTIGDEVQRPASRNVTDGYYGCGLDDLDWRFDRYGDESTTISGIVTAIDAVYVRLTSTVDGWTARPGSALLEPVGTTAATRQPEETIDWGPLSPPNADDHSYRWGTRRLEEGSEVLSGWVLTLARARVGVHPVQD